ncbi:MAG: hypothetical protein UX87_C0010G0015 [Candidatus Amesbacteria bacterium GW2011_GWA1_47_16]|uniref:Uncharacterized protein n=3 Tax=Candidatus Amesiibacteriota TaxID=1752730 RepID=A0A0G1S3U6_9BACT|nr:MAG: hypothetical protein UX86_C0012G0009 [Candidatus Amesbacteria bacterium GW2011_GWC1_47_15]KKU64250.1 MAG: hypothetical protein UX87_C0010G0015 [Candidatus Amesbacteria bacterium GW2011_GWA1_47_16]KKU98126.1 MAG: hypothetical protein UY28_C0007G0015 [Candidatus Amesbacteria bacterium GW2011_GWB1_48_13]
MASDQIEPGDGIPQVNFGDGKVFPGVDADIFDYKLQTAAGLQSDVDIIALMKAAEAVKNGGSVDPLVMPGDYRAAGLAGQGTKFVP